MNTLDVEVREIEEESYRQAHRGRAGKDTHCLRSVRLRFDLDFRIKEDEARKEALTDGVFPLVTNVLDLEEKEVLLTYKKQARVEKRFSQIKTDFEVAPVYLKNVDRRRVIAEPRTYGEGSGGQIANARVIHYSGNASVVTP